MIDYSELKSAAHTAMLGNINESMRMINVLVSKDGRIIYFIGYFDKPPKVYETELISDISSEVECSIGVEGIECKSICAYIDEPVSGNCKIKQFEQTICSEASFSVCCYVRFGEAFEVEELTTVDKEIADLSLFTKL